MHTQIYDWVPEPFGVGGDDKYNAERLERELSEKVSEENGMPEDLKNHILDEVKKNPGHVRQSLKSSISPSTTTTIENGDSFSSHFGW